ncbi:MAG: MurR/RpiR family transcriptional regulator [Candidatus Limnocylindrales bacterium]
MATPRPAEHIDPGANPMTALRAILPSLPPAERRVADGILAQPGDIVFLSIGDLASRASTSEATVVRLCQRAGFGGYPELRLALATQVGRNAAARPATRIVGTDIAADDPLADIVAKVGAADGAAISDTVEQLDLASLARVIELVVRARRIEIYGIGASGLVAIDLEHKLRRIGLPAAASVDGHMALTSAAVLGHDDLVIGISHSGETLDVIDPVAEACGRGATAVAITNYGRSSLARTADLVLTTAAAESLFRAGAMASRAAQLTVVDCIYLAVAQRHYEDTVTALDRTSAALRSRRSRGGSR